MPERLIEITELTKSLLVEAKELRRTSRVLDRLFIALFFALILSTTASIATLIYVARQQNPNETLLRMQVANVKIVECARLNTTDSGFENCVTKVVQHP